MDKEVKGWVKYAEADLGAAKLLYKNDSFPNIIIHHSHQAIEKILKGLLLSLNIKFPLIHDVNKLHSILPQNIQSELSIETDDLSMFSNVYIGTKYPIHVIMMETGEPTMDDALGYLEKAESIFSIVKEFIVK